MKFWRDVPCGTLGYVNGYFILFLDNDMRTEKKMSFDVDVKSSKVVISGFVSYYTIWPDVEFLFVPPNSS